MNKRNCPHCKRVGNRPIGEDRLTCRTCYATSNLDAWKTLPHKPMRVDLWGQPQADSCSTPREAP